MEKKCEVCNEVLLRPKKYSHKQWELRKVCSKRCLSSYMKAIPKETGWHHSPETIQKMIKNSGARGKFRSENYGAVHCWLFKNFTKEKIKCEHCGSSRFLEFAIKKGCKHEHKRENYLILCSACHKKYDYTKERKRKLSQSLTGRVIHWNKKISESLRGRVLSKEHCAKISIIQKANPRPRNEKGQFFKST